MSKYILCLIVFAIHLNLAAQNDIDSLKSNYLKAESLKVKAVAAIALSYGYLRANTDSSFFYGKRALEFAFEVENDSLIAKSYQTIGNAAIYQGNYDVALENYLSGISQIGSEKYPSILQGLNNNIGIIFDRKIQYAKAREYYLKAEGYLEKLNGLIENNDLLLRRSKLFSNIGATYESEKDPNKAMEYYVKAQGIANTIDSLSTESITKRTAKQQAIIYSNIGSLNLNTKKFAFSEINYLEALKIYEEIRERSGIARINLHLGDLYTEMGESEKAIQAFRLSILLGEETRNGETVFWASQGLYKLLEEKGDFEEAFYELERHKILNDSLFNAEKAAALERLELEHNFEEEKLRLEDEQQIKTIWNYGLIGGILSLAIIFLLVLRNLRSKARVTSLSNENLELSNKHLSLEKENLEEKLDFKNKELTTNVMYLMKKNEFINTVSDRLLGMRGLFKSDNQKSINRIVLDLQKASEDDVWHEFETHFNRVHADFYDNLSEACPNLSLNERKLCAFVKLNLTTKEICAITHQTTNTLQVARTRLRKKLELESNDQLFSYLQNF